MSVTAPVPENLPFFITAYGIAHVYARVRIKPVQSSLSDDERKQSMLAPSLFLVSEPVVPCVVWSPSSDEREEAGNNAEQSKSR